MLSKYDYFMGIAKAVGAGAKCTRREVGAIIVDENNHVVATGKNGSPPGAAECTDGACPRGRHYLAMVNVGLYGKDVCKCGKEWPCKDSVAPNSSYDTGPGTCIAIHAEANALLNRTVPSVKGCTMYITEKPCDGCFKLMQGAGIAKFYWPGESYNFKE